VILERISVPDLATLKKPPLSSRAEQGRKMTKPDRKKAAQNKRGGRKGKTFFRQKTQEVESHVKAGKTRRRQTRHHRRICGIIPATFVTGSVIFELSSKILSYYLNKCR